MDITFAENFQNIPYTMFLPNISSWLYIKSMFDKCNE